MGQKTRAEIDELIIAWRDDPSWEIEDTEGFEDHKPELLALRLKCEAEWKARAEDERRAAVAELIGPAMAILPAAMQHAAQTIGTDLHLALHMWAEMLLPLKQQLDRLDAEHERVVADLRDEIHELRSKIGAAR